MYHLQQLQGKLASRGVHIARQGKYLSALIQGIIDGGMGAASFLGFDEQYPIGKTGNNAVAHRKMMGKRRRGRGKLGYDGAAAFDNFFRQFLVFRRIINR